MKLVKYIKNIPNLLIFLVLSFILSFIFYFYFQFQYMKNIESSYINSIKNEVKLLIEKKRKNTYDLAQILALNKKIINIMKSKKYDLLYKINLEVPQKFKSYKNVWIRIIDKKGVTRYLSWTKKGLGVSILDKKNLAEVFKNNHLKDSISVGLYDITFKGITPIYDEQNNFLGVVEIITHFNSIAKDLEKNHIYSALVVTKNFSKKIKYPFSKHFINGYYISTLDLNKEIKQILKDKGIEYFIKSKNYQEVEGTLFSKGYFITKVKIVDSKNRVIGYYLIFIKDIKNIQLKEKIFIFLTFVMLILFIITSLYGFKTHIKNINLIENLNDKVRKEVEKNLALIYKDRLTSSLSKEKFLVDKKDHKDDYIVMFNIKNFSQINAIYGFETGDKVLKHVSESIKKLLKRDIYRINADEFVFFSKDFEDDIFNIKKHFEKNPISITKNNIKIRLFFSFAIVKSVEKEALRKLNIAIRKAKKEPYKPYVFYKKEHINKKFIKFNSYIYDAVYLEKKAKLIPYFQGIRNNKTGKITKYEVLARLKIDEQIYTPNYFIDIAKNSGFFEDLSKKIIDKSLLELSKYGENIEISINITESDLESNYLKDYLLQKTSYYNINPQRITLEILENISATNTKNNIIQLIELKKAGFKLAIDDFGIEYSNFERIYDLDVDYIKIDGKYIKNLDKSEKSFKIVKAINEFAHSMGIEIVAEYVKNERIQKIIEKLDITYSQGFYFSIPSEKIQQNES